MLSPDFAWTDERVAQLKKLIADGLPASQIASEFGGGLSRSAVLGKASRLGLRLDWKPRQPKAVQSKGETRAVRRKAHPLPSLVCEEIPAEVPTVEPPLHIDLLDLKPHHCRYPYGDGPFTFCGHQVAPDKPYCAAHWAACNTGRP